jgi:hypothetical protein
MRLMLEKVVMKKTIIFLMLLSSFPVWISAEDFDGFEITLNTSYLWIFMGNDYSDKYVLAEDAPLLNSSLGFSTLSVDGFQLQIDRRPYEGRDYLDFPLRMILDPGQYTLTVTSTTINNKATILRFIDKTKPDVFVDLLKGAHSFSVDEKKEYRDRFVLRVYAACLFKKDASSNEWTNTDNWLGGGVPGVSNDAKINNCVVLPEGANAIIPSGTTLTIGTLLNSGILTIQEGAVLTVNNGAILAPVSEMY